MLFEEKLFPIAEKVCSGNPIHNSSDGSYDIDGASESEFDAIVSKSLIIFDGRSTIHYLDENPFCIYRCNKEACPHMDPNYYLNSTVKEIALSFVDAGRKYYLSSPGKLEIENLGKDTVVYFKDTKGQSHLIKDDEVLEFLLKKPDLFVTREGMLVFCADNDILITFDFNHYYWERHADYMGVDGVIDKAYLDKGRFTFETTSEIGKMRRQILFRFDYSCTNPINYVMSGCSID